MPRSTLSALQDPRTGEMIMDVAEAGAEDVDLAVKAARKVSRAAVKVVSYNNIRLLGEC